MNDVRPVIAAGPVYEVSSGDQAVRQALRAWRRHKSLIAFSFLAVLAAGFAILETLTPAYTATVSVTKSSPMPEEMLSSEPQAVDPSQSQMDALTAVALLRSRSVAAAVLAQFPPPPAAVGLEERAVGAFCRFGMTAFCRTSAAPSGAALREAQIDDFLTHLSVVPEPETQCIDVSVTDPDPTRAANLANAVVQAYMQAAIAQQNAEIAHIESWLADRSSALQKGWLDASRQANDFAASHHIAVSETGSATGPLIDQQVSAVAASLNAAQAQLDGANAQADALSDARAHGQASSLVAQQSQPVLVAAGETLIQLENERNNLSAEFGPNYPKIVALNQQIASTHAELNGQTGTALAGIRENVVAAGTQVKQLTAQLDALRARAASQNADEAQFMALSSKASSIRTAYETFLQHADDVEARASLLQPPISVVSPAVPPLTPSFPKKGKLGIGIFLLALVTGAGAGLLKDRAARGFGQADDLSASLQLPVLAALPVVRGKRTAILRHVLDEPYSRCSEAVRGLAATLALQAGPHAGSRTVLISSAGALEGKSTIATWLAMSARQAGQHVLLIDGDHRRGSLMRGASDGDKPGFSDLLARKASLEEVVQFDPETKLAFISSGSSMTGAFATIDIARLREVLATLKKTFALVVIDSPPLLAMVDGLVWGSIADQTVFVCRWEHSSRQAVTGCLERLRTYGARAAGVVVSMVGRNATLEFGNEYSRHELKLINRYYGG